MPSQQATQTGFVSLRGPQATDGVGGLFTLGSIAQDAVALYGKELSGMRKVHLFGADLYGHHTTAIDAAVAFDRAAFLGGKKANRAASA